MNIGMILNAPYPSDIRVVKEASALIEAGHQIHLLCIKRSNEKSKEVVDGIHIHRIKVATSLYGMAFWDSINAIQFIHPLFKSALKNFIIENSIQALHVHDLPLAGTALTMQTKLKVKVVLDFHENYPEALKIWFSWQTNPIAKLKNKIFFNYKKWLSYENAVVKKADRVIAVVEEMKQRLLDTHQIPWEKVVIVTNTETKEFARFPKQNDIYGSDLQNKFIITYTGNIGPHRGVDTAIEAMQHLKTHKNIVLVIVGSGSKSVIAKLHALVNQYDLKDQVVLLGYQPFSNFPSYMANASVNIIPHHQNPHTDNTIPHKLYQNMLSGKPVLVSSSTPLKRVVEEIGSGLVFEAGNHEDLASKILSLYQDKNLAESLGKNGFEAAYNGAYNWETTKLTLVQLYQSLLF
jgi:glycosyltransferase involved in cell wall biosynthesis